MLKLSGKKLIQIKPQPIDKEVKILYFPNDKDYILVCNGEAYELIKEDKYLVWNIPDDLVKTELEIQIQAINPETEEICYVTDAIILKTVTAPKYDSNYPLYNMVDDHPVIPIIDRKISVPTNYTIAVSRDTSAQMLTFDINRYVDGVDLSDKVCNIVFYNANKIGGRAVAANVRKGKYKLTFGWLLDDNVTAAPGKVQFAIQFLGYNEFNQPYRYHSLPAELKIENGLWVDDVEIEEKYPSIIEDMQIQLKTLETMISLGGGGSGSADYNYLLNKPIITVSGSPVILNTLSTGVYKIVGSWIVVSEAEEFQAFNDDVFYLSNENGECKITRINSNGISIIKYSDGDSIEDIVYDKILTANSMLEQIREGLWGSF